MVTGADGAEDLRPGVFGISQHGRDELGHLVVGRRRMGGSLFDVGRLSAAQQADDGARTDAEKVRGHQSDGDRSYADRAAAQSKTASAIFAAAVFHVIAFAVSFPSHIASYTFIQLRPKGKQHTLSRRKIPVRRASRLCSILGLLPARSIARRPEQVSAATLCSLAISDKLPAAAPGVFCRPTIVKATNIKARNTQQKAEKNSATGM